MLREHIEKKLIIKGRSTKQEQHGVMEADEEQKLLYAQTSLSDCANITAIFPDNDTSDTTSNTSPSDEKSASADGPEDAPEGAPPAYTPADPAPKSTSGFASAWQAFTSHFTPRADPLASALCRAITNGDMSQVRGLLAQGAPLSGRDENSQTSLQCAIAADNEPAFQLLLAAGASTQGTSSGWLGGGEMPLLFQAAVAGKLKIAQALVDAGADVHETSIFGQPYFYDVCKFGTRQGVEFLLQNGASATTQSVGGRPVLVLAVRSGNVELAALLLRHGADARCSDLTGSPAVVLAADLMYTKMLTLLLDHGADVDAYTVKGCSLLADVIGASKRDMANLLLERGANGDISDVYGQPIVVRIVRDEKMAVEEKEDLLQRLMKNGATGDVTDFAWALPVLRYALESDTITTRIIELLLQHDAKPDDVTMADGATALLYAIDKGKRDVARLLVRHGADVNAADEKGRRPLMQAVIRGDVDMVNVLRAAGAKVKDEGMGDVAAVARALGKPEMMKALGL